jgi:hypothetical protein
VWIIPSQLRTSSLSVQGLGDSTSELNLPSHCADLLESSAMWRGKHLPSKRWLAAWKRESWLQHLFGQMSSPLTAGIGVGLWMESLAATRVSRSALPGAGEVMRTSATCGPASPVLLARFAPSGASSRTSLDTSAWDSQTFEMIFSGWATELRRACLLRRKSVRLISANGFSSSRWPSVPNGGQASQWATPTSRDWKDGENPSSAVPTNSLLGRQAPRTMTAGKLSLILRRWVSESSRLSLNPFFVEWLMGLPIGWTCSEPSGMESYLCRQRMLLLFYLECYSAAVMENSKL